MTNCRFHTYAHQKNTPRDSAPGGVETREPTLQRSQTVASDLANKPEQHSTFTPVLGFSTGSTSGLAVDHMQIRHRGDPRHLQFDRKRRLLWDNTYHSPNDAEQ